MARAPTVSVVIPTLKEAGAIEATLAHVFSLAPDVEVIVVDGGSDDGTAALAARAGARVLHAERGRGAQMHVGATAATGSILCFLHADTRLPIDALQQIRTALADPRIIGGHFHLIFDGNRRAARLLTWLYVHLAWLGLRYGDSVYFVRRQAYDAAGGFRPLPIFEDLDLLRRLQRCGHFVRLAGPAVTASRRFEGRSFTLTFAHWSLLQLLYWLGVPPRWLGRLYPPIRQPGRGWWRRVSSS